MPWIIYFCKPFKQFWIELLLNFITFDNRILLKFLFNSVLFSAHFFLCDKVFLLLYLIAEEIA